MSYGDKFEDLKGKYLSRVTGLEPDSESVTFVMEDGEVYRLYHSQSCCESVYIVDVDGDVADLKGLVTVAEETKQDGCDEKDFTEDTYGDDKTKKVECHESCTWTFYHVGTPKGSVRFRWLGESNGYYSETASFGKVSS